ncbi:MAG TPA: fatty acid desaturase [Nostocaceae cyanobacterium]|nr:fatty acid desaturase [Nostocaceae cyanobacterium]
MNIEEDSFFKIAGIDNTSISKPNATNQLKKIERQTIMKYRVLINTIMIIYTLIGHVLGLYLVLSHQIWLNLLGIILISHTSILAALLSHEFMHDTIFHQPKFNYWFGVLMSGINGASYVSFKLLKQQHIDHHHNKVGYDGFSITTWTLSLPSILQALIVALEFCYIPVLSFISRWRSLTVPLIEAKYQHLRVRIVTVFICRSLFFACLFLIHPWSLLYIFCAHTAMINILRVYDCYHHTFKIIPQGSAIPKLEKNYEQKNTFSSLISLKYYWLNWLFLNYGYHNAHHHKPNANWILLSQINHELYGNSQAHCILFKDLIYWYHKNRINRIFRGIGTPKIENGQLRIDEFWGVIMNISFIVYGV